MNKSVFVFLSFLTTVSVNLFAQTASLLSTETIGLGKFNFANNVSTQGMGGLSTIYQSPFGTELNFNNPAANSNLSQTVFDINGFYGYSSQVVAEKDNSVGGFNFNRISLGFPISDKIKFGLSYKQFTNANEEKLFSKSTISNGLSFDATDSYGKTEVNSINGGLKKLESFVSYNYSKSLSLGLNVGYFSGNIANVSSEIISNQVENPSEIKTIGIEDPKNYNIRKNIEAQSTDDIGVKSLAFTLGVLKTIELKKDKSILLGATFGSGTNTEVIKSNTSNVVTSFILTEAIAGSKSILTDQATQFPALTDLVTTNVPTSSTNNLSLKSLNRFSFSTGYEEKENFMVGIDFQFEGTGIFNDLYKTPTLDLVYQNRYRISSGGWWIPNINSNKSYFEKIIYRGGLYYEQTPIQLDGKSIKDIGATVGVGLPIGKNTQSRINFGIEYINRGSLINFSSNVNSLVFNFGINFNGVWFAKRLID